jgi:hypothetical protein
MTELEVIDKKLNEHRDNMIDALSSGGCKDFGEYQRMCGVLYGLNLAKSDIQDLRKRLETSDDE